MHLDRAAESMLAGAVLLAFVAVMALLNAVAAALAHVNWVVVALGSMGLTTVGSLSAARAFAVVPLAQRIDGEVWGVVDDPRAARP